MRSSTEIAKMGSKRARPMAKGENSRQAQLRASGAGPRAAKFDTDLNKARHHHHLRAAQRDPTGPRPARASGTPSGRDPKPM